MRKNVLIIDDDPDLRDFLQQAIALTGCRVETVERGADGLRKLLTDHYDLALIDINMPEISGPNICRALRQHEQTQELPVVMITATYHSQEQINAARQDYGVSDFLFKPFSMVDLRRLLERIFNPDQQAIATELAVAQPLDDHTIPTQLHKLYVAKATGLLHLHRGNAKKIIYIKDGYPIFARSNVLGECLGRMLVSEGMITQVDCDQSVEKSRDSGRLQGTVLIEMGLLTPQDLKDALVRQVTEKLLATFAWTSGTIRFESARDFRKEVTQIRLTPAALILQGITRYWTGPQLEAFLLPYSQDYLLQASDPQYRFQDIALSKRAAAVFRRCRGRKTLEEILEDHPLARREVQSLIAALLISELLEHHPEPQEGEELVEEEVAFIDEKLRHKILEDYRRIMDADYFSALGITQQSDTGAARRAYYRLAKEYHPDRFLGSGLSAEMSAKINEMFQYITQAYTVLSDPAARADYLEELVHGPKHKVDINQVIEAEGAYQEGRALLKVRRFSAAARALKRAIELSPEEPEYLADYAWALFKSGPEIPQFRTQALEILLTARELNPGSDRVHLSLGHIYLAEDKERQAEKAFEMAVQANPDCTEALRELRLINLRREQAAQGKGLFAGLLKKEKKDKKDK